MIFSGTLKKCRDLRICFAHGGGSFPATLGRIEHGFAVRPDLVAVDNQINPREYADKIYYDSLVHAPEMLEFLVNLAGAEKVMLGTDYPFPLGELKPGSLIESMTFDKNVKEMLLHQSALDWLNLEKDFFI